MWYLIVSIPDLCTLTYFKDVSIDERVRDGCCAGSQAHMGLTVGIIFAPVLS